MRRVIALLVGVGGWIGIACGSTDYGAANDGADAATVEAAATDSAAPPDVAVGPDTAPPQDAGPSWKLYANSETFPNTWSEIDLASAWTGANAPPPRGIMAVTQLTHQDRLLVWADDGKFYVRADGVWQPPQLTKIAFPLLEGVDFRGAYHQPDYPTSGVEELTLCDNPKAYLYTMSAAGALNLEVPAVTLSDEGMPYGAPKGTKKVRWVLRSWDLMKTGAASLTEYSGYDGDDYVYYYDGTPKPAGKWLYKDAPLFLNKTNVPPKDRIMAGWRDDALTTNYLIVK